MGKNSTKSPAKINEASDIEIDDLTKEQGQLDDFTSSSGSSSEESDSDDEDEPRSVVMVFDYLDDLAKSDVFTRDNTIVKGGFKKPLITVSGKKKIEKLTLQKMAMAMTGKTAKELPKGFKDKGEWLNFVATECFDAAIEGLCRMKNKDRDTILEKLKVNTIGEITLKHFKIGWEPTNDTSDDGDSD